jgi:hypothetical protein
VGCWAESVFSIFINHNSLWGIKLVSLVLLFCSTTKMEKAIVKVVLCALVLLCIACCSHVANASTASAGHGTSSSQSVPLQKETVNVDEILVKTDFTRPESKVGRFSPAQIAVSVHRADLLKIALEHGANPNELLRDKSLLMFAVVSNQTDIVDMLLSHGATVELESSAGFTALSLAAANGNLEISKVLVKAGAVPQHGSHNGDAFSIACEEGKLDIVKFFYKDFPSISKLSMQHCLWVAAAKNNVGLVEYLLSLPVYRDLVMTKDYALAVAISLSLADIARLLIQKGANTNFDASVTHTAGLLQELGMTDDQRYKLSQDLRTLQTTISGSGTVHHDVTDL